MSETFYESIVSVSIIRIWNCIKLINDSMKRNFPEIEPENSKIRYTNSSLLFSDHQANFINTNFHSKLSQNWCCPYLIFSLIFTCNIYIDLNCLPTKKATTNKTKNRRNNTSEVLMVKDCTVVKWCWIQGLMNVYDAIINTNNAC